MFFKKKIYHFICSVIFIIYLNPACSNSDSSLYLHFDNAYVKLPLIGSDSTSGYANITNRTDYLISVEGISCSGVSLSSFHETLVDHMSGSTSMEKIERFKIFPNKSIKFSPGGKHIMLMGISEEFTKGDKITCQIFTDPRGIVKVELEIQ